jgi:hypothetical protein
LIFCKESFIVFFKGVIVSNVFCCIVDKCWFVQIESNELYKSCVIFNPSVFTYTNASSPCGSRQVV